MATAKDSSSRNPHVSAVRVSTDASSQDRSEWEKLYSSRSRNPSIAPFAPIEPEDSSASDPELDSDADNGAQSGLQMAIDTAFSLPIIGPPRGNQTIRRAQSCQPSLSSNKPWNVPTEHTSLKIIVNGNNDLNQVKEILRAILKWSQTEEQEPHPWYLGLMACRIQFQSPRLIDLRKLIEPSLRVPYWLKLKTDEEFTETTLKFDFQQSKFEFSLAYGALTSLNRFHYSPGHIWTSKNIRNCRLYFQNHPRNHHEIQWTLETNENINLIKCLFTMNINECVIIELLPRGFIMYIEQKCNMTEFEEKVMIQEPSRTRCRSSSRSRQSPRMRHSSEHSNSANPRQFFSKSKRRQGRRSHFFSTIQFRLEDKNDSLRCESDNRVQSALTSLIQFFLSHNLSVCFAKVNSGEGLKPDSVDIDGIFIHYYLVSFLMAYAWHMLKSVGYRFFIGLEDNQIMQAFRNLASAKQEEEEFFYRVCVYLYRVLLIRPFINIPTEIECVAQDLQRKQDASPDDFRTRLQLDNSSWTYIPSVTLTPTTIRVNPLKISKTNRVLRDPFFGNPRENFLLVDIREENGKKLMAFAFRDLRQLLLEYLEEGFFLAKPKRSYRYLHHSQSQLRQQQFWFYHHPKDKFDDLYRHLGDFSRERNPAKYAARMGQAFSTTQQTVLVQENLVSRIPDVKTADGNLLFSDGCGTMSKSLRDQIQEYLGRRYDFSVIQLRYAGVKGVLSLDHRIRDPIKMCLRPSMIKFECDNHHYVEVCKFSGARPLSLNRQAILLLSNRRIPDSNFLILQQKHYLNLVRNLLRNKNAEQLLMETMPSRLLSPDIHQAQIDYIHEPFFRQLIINSSIEEVRNLSFRTRIRIPVNQGRNMFGIMDEYGVLKEDEVFIQYTVLRDDEDPSNQAFTGSLRVVNGCDVVITKNPCHHPGDVRRFKAREYSELKHLKDVVVFSQRGKRPAPNMISGSDLDGDEYLVLWHPDLVPYQTENYPAFDYNSRPPAQEHEGPITRRVINETVLDIAEQDRIGILSNLHLTYADRFGLAHPDTLRIAEAISDEVDSAKTGYRSITNEEIRNLKRNLENRRPDFVNDRKLESYPSKMVLGHLYRASKRQVRGWNRFIGYYRHLRHLRIDINDPDIDGDLSYEENRDENLVEDQFIYQATDFRHPHYRECEAIAQSMATGYRGEMLQILNLYGLTHESDLWCRNSKSPSGADLEDSAFAELEQLVKRTRALFYMHQIQFCDTQNCRIDTPYNNLCRTCQWTRSSLAVACYRICYGERSSNSSAGPILSLPWLLSDALFQGRSRTNPPNSLPLSAALKNALGNILSPRCEINFNGSRLQLSCKGKESVSVSLEIRLSALLEVLRRTITRVNKKKWDNVIKLFSLSYQNERDWSTKNCNDDWEIQLRPTVVNGPNSYVDQLSALAWDNETDELMHAYFDRLIKTCFDEARRSNDGEYLDISEQIILLLQKAANDEDLMKN